MSFLISDAVAQSTGTTPQGGGLASFVPLILIFVANFDILLKYRRVRHHILNRLG